MLVEISKRGKSTVCICVWASVFVCVCLCVCVWADLSLCVCGNNGKKNTSILEA